MDSSRNPKIMLGVLAQDPECLMFLVTKFYKIFTFLKEQQNFYVKFSIFSKNAIFF